MRLPALSTEPQPKYLVGEAILEIGNKEKGDGCLGTSDIEAPELGSAFTLGPYNFVSVCS